MPSNSTQLGANFWSMGSFGGGVPRANMTQMYNFIDEGSPSGATESYRSSSVTGVFKNVTAEIFLEPKAVLDSLKRQYIGNISGQS